MMRPSTKAIIVEMLIILLILFGIIFGSIVAQQDAKADLPRMDSLMATYTADGDCIKAYVLRDPDTGIEYLVTDHGGIAQRVTI